MFLVAAAILLFAASSCSGHKQQSALTALGSSVPSDLSNLTEPLETTIDSALAEIENLQPPDGVNESIFSELKSALANALRSNRVLKYVSRPPTGQQNSVADLTLVDDGAGGYLLMWHYHNLGDYNQDGTVGVADITPLAIYFNQIAPDPNSIQGVVDGDESKLVGVADVTPIAMNFSSDCAGYLVQTAPAADGPWTSPGEFVPLAAGTGTGRLLFQYPLPPTANGYSRVVPVDKTNLQGIESNVVAIPAMSEIPSIISVTPIEGITGDSYSFSAVVTGIPPLTYAWDFGGGTSPNTSTEANPLVMLGTAGSYLASVQVSNVNGNDVYNFVLTVTASGNPPLIARVSPAEGIAGSFISVTADVTGTSPLLYNWNFGGGATPNDSTAARPTVSLCTAGNYPASLTVANDYGSNTYDFSLTVTASGNPPIIDGVSPKEGIAGSFITPAADFSGTSPVSYSWDFGGGASPNLSTKASPGVTLGAPGDYLASLTITNAYGSDTRQFTLKVTASGNPPVIGSVSPREGITGSVISLTPGVSGTSPFSYSWNFGGGATPNTSSIEKPSITLSAAGKYLASLAVTNAYGSNTYGFIVTVTEAGSPPFISGLSPEEGIAGTTTTFIASTSGTSPFSYSWDFGGGAIPNTSRAANPTVVMGAIGTYSASLTVTNNYGSDTYDFLLDVTENGNHPSISGVSQSEGIAGSFITFSADFTGTSPFSYSWNFGGGAIPNTSVSPNPAATLGAVGSYPASLTITNAFGNDTYNFTLTVTESGRPPVISGVTPTQGAKGTRITFNVDVTGTSPLSYNWNFGGGATPNTSRKIQPNVKLKTPRDYNASVTVSNAHGSDTFYFILTVVP